MISFHLISCAHACASCGPGQLKLCRGLGRPGRGGVAGPGPLLRWTGHLWIRTWDLGLARPSVPRCRAFVQIAPRDLYGGNAAPTGKVRRCEATKLLGVGRPRSRGLRLCDARRSGARPEPAISRTPSETERPQRAGAVPGASEARRAVNFGVKLGLPTQRSVA